MTISADITTAPKAMKDQGYKYSLNIYTITNGRRQSLDGLERTWVDGIKEARKLCKLHGYTPHNF